MPRLNLDYNRLDSIVEKIRERRRDEVRDTMSRLDWAGEGSNSDTAYDAAKKYVEEQLRKRRR